MAVNFKVFESYLPIEGLRLGITQAGVRYPNRDDLVLIELDAGSRVAGVFTTNAFCAAPVTLCKEHLASSDIRYLLVNTGNANAGTGPQGFTDAEYSCGLVANICGCEPQQVLPFSTGVIGEPLDMTAFERGIPHAFANLDSANWARAATGIMTTDTLPKGYSRQLTLDDETITITGISKGAGMIMPNMATMLGYIATDANISQSLLDDWCRQLANKSFNRITIDGDTSTNDSCMLVATGKRGGEITSDSERANVLFAALEETFIALAQAIVRDGEGATKFVTIDVEQALSTNEALDVAYTVAHSPLVKTALFASDANWGRILAAVGRAGLKDLNLEGIQIYLDNVHIVENGGRAASYTEEAGAAIFAKDEFTIRIVLGRGDQQERLWTTDLSHDYVSINADYRS